MVVTNFCSICGGGKNHSINLTPIDFDQLNLLIGPCDLLLAGFDFYYPRFMFMGEA
jgi:hypothetical protein